MHPLHYVSVGVCILLVAGISVRKNKHAHIPFMLSAFVIDVLMVLGIELNRHAIHTARTTHDRLLQIHIAISVLVVLLYVFQIVTGIKMAKGRPNRIHGKTGCTLVLLRFGNLVTSVMVMHGR